MFEDMWHSCIIRGIRLEADGEDIVRVFSCNMQIICAGLVVLQMQCCQLELWDMFRAKEGEAMNFLPWLWILSKLRNRFPNSSLGRVSQHPGFLTIDVEGISAVSQA